MEIVAHIDQLKRIALAVVDLKAASTPEQWQKANRNLKTLMQGAGLYMPNPKPYENEMVADLFVKINELYKDDERFIAKVGQLLGLGETAGKSEIIQKLERIDIAVERLV